jgi:hypothetical protein
LFYLTFFGVEGRLLWLVTNERAETFPLFEGFRFFPFKQMTVFNIGDADCAT